MSNTINNLSSAAAHKSRADRQPDDTADTLSMQTPHSHDGLHTHGGQTAAHSHEQALHAEEQHPSAEPHLHGHAAHAETHTHGQHDAAHSHALPAGTVLTIRAHSGLSGDIFLAGLLRMTELDAAGTEELLRAIMPELSGTVHLTRASVHGIGGWHAEVSLPHQHAHRTLADILAIIQASGMLADAKQRAAATFTLLARAEATVHGKNPDDVQFHEVGALDSILDICLTCELFTRLAPAHFVVSPLPLADGWVRCAHGIIPTPAPAVLELLEDIPVRPFNGTGETVTPTGIALLRSLGAQFGPWPAMRVEKKALVYGSTVFEDAPNGAIFAYGTTLTA